jgi:hypothetical protein
METKAAFRRSQAARQLVRDCNALVAAITDLGGLREPEISAATGMDEDRVYYVAAEAVRLGMVVRRKADGELSCAPGWLRAAAVEFGA